ncbi:hypothetical protein APSETT444_007781 [Aspergillus pseudonomiae]
MGAESKILYHTDNESASNAYRENSQQCLIATHATDFATATQYTYREDNTSQPEWMPGVKEWLVTTCISILVMMDAFNTTVVIPLMPGFSSIFQQPLESVLWINTSYLIGNASGQGLFAMLAEVLGHGPILLSSAVLATTGTGICGGSLSLSVLIAGRFIQGFGGGGVVGVSLLIVAELIPKSHQVQFSTYIFRAQMIGMVIGSVAGGVYHDYTNYIWAFYSSFVFCAMGLLVIPFALDLRGHGQENKLSTTSRFRTMDWIGAILTLLGMGTLLTGIGWEGTQNTLDSWQTLVPICVGSIFLIALVFHQTLWAMHPMFSSRVFRDLSSTMLQTGGFLHGFIKRKAIRNPPNQHVRLHKNLKHDLPKTLGNETCVARLALPQEHTTYDELTTTLVLASVFTLWFKTRFTLYQDSVEERRTTRRERERQRRRQEVRDISTRIVEQVLRESGTRDGGVQVGEVKMVNGVDEEGVVLDCVEGGLAEEGLAEEVESEKGFGDLDGGVVVGVEAFQVGGSLGEDEVSVGVGEVEELEGEGYGEVVEEKWVQDGDEVEVCEEPVGQEAIDEKVEVDVVEEKADEGISTQWIEDITDNQEEKQVVQDENQKIAQLEEVKQEEPQWEETKPDSTTWEEETQTSATWADEEKQEKPIEEEKEAATEVISKASESHEQPEPEKEVKKPEPKPVEAKPAGLSQSRWNNSLSGSKKVLDPRATTFQPTEFKSSAKSQFQFSLPTTTRPQSSTPLAYSSLGVLASSSSSPLSAYSPPSIFSSMGRIVTLRVLTTAAITMLPRAEVEDDQNRRKLKAVEYWPLAGGPVTPLFILGWSYFNTLYGTHAKDSLNHTFA